MSAATERPADGSPGCHFALTSSTFIIAPPAHSGVAFERAWRAIRTGFEPAALRPLPKITESLRPALYGTGRFPATGARSLKPVRAASALLNSRTSALAGGTGVLPWSG